ncbi:hypothetical protein [Pseudobacteriovorax antillogorgiicola]|uniref:Uncharacterized protein n=1 Tax=Pseudobacteriovorax antillogorgiicola TaxID=1513793 RepID=A0A1Y6BEW9_9BACT|nr:hypothetical protein [Pseudobacteriovorax antillogorgiicola]TCS56270.1 hypothetical protein EDD56_10492 [Pseudobacteriovorax antillogorgiicola]SMF07784.1 hypothetical protein SAMN06296036_104241 [Pseudobacteriovorax antillogorgiicola]
MFSRRWAWSCCILPLIMFSFSAYSKEASGSGFLVDTWDVHPAKRERLALDKAIQGEIPDFIFRMKPITVEEFGHRITFYVSPNYLALGSKDDFFLMPFNFISACKIAKHYNAVLPTPKMVDLIYKSADIKLKPATMKPGPSMIRNSYIKKHDQGIKASLVFQDYHNKLVAGHKKDTVLSNVLSRAKDRIAIYGWHQSESQTIQPLSIWHWANYADYSHGVRLVDRNVVVDGEFWDIADVLSMPEFAPLLSYEGVLAIDELMNPHMTPKSLAQQ